MNDQSLPLMTFYKGWGSYQKMLADVLTQLSVEQLSLPASADHWTIGMIAQHVIANRVWWFQYWMGEGRPDLAPIAHWDPADRAWTPVNDPATLLRGLESTWQLVADSLNKWTAADLDQMFQPPSAMSEEEREMFGSFSRGWIIWHVVEHEIHHGGEMSLALGNHGIHGIYGDM